MRYKPSSRFYLIIFLLLIMIPLLALSLNQANRFADQKRTYYLQQSNLRAEALKNFIYQIISNDIKILQMIAVVFRNNPGLELHQKQDILDQLTQTAGIFQGIYVANLDGISEVTSPAFNDKGLANAPKSYKERDYYKELIQTGKTALSKVQRGKTSNQPAVQIAAPIYDHQNELKQYIAANIHINVLAQQAEKNVSDDPRFRIVLTDRLNDVIFDSQNISPTYSNIQQVALFQKAKDINDSHFYAKDEKQRSVLTFTTHVDILNYQWHLFVIFPVDEIEKEASEAKNIILTYAFVILITLTLVVYFVVMRIRKKTNEMVLFMQKIGEGRFQEAVTQIPEIELHEGQMMIDALINTVNRLDESIKARKQAEDSARMSDKLASIGTMAAGIAHEINNPLSYINGNLDYALELCHQIDIQLDAFNYRTLPLSQDFEHQNDLRYKDIANDFTDIKEALQDTKLGVTKVSDIVKSLLVLSRKEQSELLPTPIRKVIDGCLKIANSEIKNKAKVQLNIPANIPLVLANESQLGQVILNLLMNAIQAMPKRDFQENLIEINAYLDKENIIIEVKDNASGIPEELLSKIFDPFFTTKPIGKGTGLGLSICLNIIQNFKGSLTVESIVGVGTTFKIQLPAILHPNEVKIKEITPMPRIITPLDFQRPPEFNILIVDDMIEVAKSIKRQLSHDYDCVVIDSPIKALKILKDHSFDCIISDVMMPEMNADIFFEEMMKLNPELRGKLIFVSGGVLNQELEMFFEREQLKLIPKPINMNILLDEIKQIQKKRHKL